MLCGRWLVQRGQRVAVLLTALHRNEEHWGGKWGSPHEFNPERFMPGRGSSRRPAVWFASSNYRTVCSSLPQCRPAEHYAT
jgi:cytochrome P450